MSDHVVEYYLPVRNYGDKREKFRAHVTRTLHVRMVIGEQDYLKDLELAFVQLDDSGHVVTSFPVTDRYLLAVHPESRNCLATGNHLLLFHQIMTRINQGLICLRGKRYFAPPSRRIPKLPRWTLSLGEALRRLFPDGMLVVEQKLYPTVDVIPCNYLHYWNAACPGITATLQKILQTHKPLIPLYYGCCAGIVRCSSSSQFTFEDPPPRDRLLFRMVGMPLHLIYLSSYGPEPVSMDPDDLLEELLAIYGGQSPLVRRRVAAALLLAAVNQLFFVNAEYPTYVTSVYYPILRILDQHLTSPPTLAHSLAALLQRISYVLAATSQTLPVFELQHRLRDRTLQRLILRSYLRGQRLLPIQPPPNTTIRSWLLERQINMSPPLQIALGDGKLLNIWQPMFVFFGYRLWIDHTLSRGTITVPLRSLPPDEPVTLLGRQYSRSEALKQLQTDRILARRIAASLLQHIRQCSYPLMRQSQQGCSGYFLPLQMVNSSLHYFGLAPVLVDYDMPEELSHFYDFQLNP